MLIGQKLKTNPFAFLVTNKTIKTVCPSMPCLKPLPTVLTNKLIRYAKRKYYKNTVIHLLSWVYFFFWIYVSKSAVFTKLYILGNRKYVPLTSSFVLIYQCPGLLDFHKNQYHM